MKYKVGEKAIVVNITGPIWLPLYYLGEIVVITEISGDSIYIAEEHGSNLPSKYHLTCRDSQLRKLTKLERALK